MKKKFTDREVLSRNFLSQLYLIMKLTLFFLITSFLGLFATESYSQITQITLDLKSVTVKDALKAIENESEFFFIYNNELINVDREIDIRVKNQKITEVLNTIFDKKEVEITVIDRKIVLAPAFMGEQQSTKKITGKVTDSSGATLPGVSVVVKGTTNGVITDSNGNFTLSSVPDNSILQFSFVGMKMQEIAVQGKTNINVKLEEESVGIEEVVAIGYGTMKKSDLTGTVSSLRSDNFNKGASVSLNQLMDGKAAGVRVIQNSNEPGGAISVNIRGAGSVSAGTEPLYVIDGLPMDNTAPVIGSGRNYTPSNTVRSPLNSINPEDIESIEILKDASATAIYGSRGANGVVMITTKKGKAGKTNLNYSGYAGIQNVSNKLKLLNPVEYMTILNDIIAHGGGSANEKVTEIQGEGTDWQDEIYQTNALIQNHNISFDGGSDKTSFFLGLNYFDQQGVVKTSRLTRYAVRINMTNAVTDKFNIGLNLSTSYTKDSFAPEGSGFNEGGGAIYSALNMDPTIAIMDPVTGRYQRSPYITADNPLAILYGKTASSSNYRTFGTLFGDYKILPGLVAKLNIGGNIYTQRRDVYVDRSTVDGLAASGSASILNGTVGNYLAEGTLTYNKDLDIHHFTFLAGSTVQRFVTNRNSLESAGFPSDGTGTNNVDSGTQSTYMVYSNKEANTLLSFLGRVNYALKDRYLFTASFRADGSSRFGSNNKYGYFPSFAGAWKINQEEFLKSISAINNLKLRTSWGRTGNQSIPSYQSFVTYANGPMGVFNGKINSTQEPTRLSNPDLKWETTEQTNVGLDVGLFANRISLNLDYYYKITFDMLLNKPVTTTSGFTSQLTNIGRIGNTGFEFTINSQITDKAFKWNISYNMATLKNKVIDMGGVNDIYIGSAGILGAQPAIVREGEPLYSFFGYKIIGVWQKTDDFSKTKDPVHPGDFKYLDVNEDGTVNADDRVILGNGFPKLSYGFSNNFEYKRFSMDIQIVGVSGLKMFNNNLVDEYFPVNFRRNKFAVPYLERWTDTNPSNTYPSFITPLSQGQKIVNSYTVQDASYIRLQTVTLSYKIPKIRKFVRSGSIYITGQNLYTITGYEGMDPAVNPNGNSNYRVDFNAYPLSINFLLGVNLDF